MVDGIRTFMNLLEDLYSTDEKQVKRWIMGNFEIESTFSSEDYDPHNSIEVLSDGTANLSFCQEVTYQGLENFRVKFGSVDGNFTCSHCEITSLINGPTEVNGHFDCSHNPLVNLEGLPNFVGKITISWHENLPMLRLLNLKGVRILGPLNLIDIFKTYIGRNDRKGIAACASELRAAGYGGNAKW